MVLLLNEATFPPEQTSNVGQAYADWLKENPPDPSIEKELGIGVLNTEDGNMLSIGMGDIVKGKVEEVLKRTTQQNLFIANKVEGFKFKTKVILNYTEVYEILGITAPEV